MNQHKISKGFSFSLAIIVLLSLLFSTNGIPSNSVYAQEEYARHIWVDLTHNTVNANDWPMGEEVTCTVDDPNTTVNPDYIGTDIVHAASWNPDMRIAEFSMGSLLLQPGFVITMSDEFLVREFSLKYIAVKSIDIPTNTISGIAPPEVPVRIWTLDENIQHSTMSDSNGNWSLIDLNILNGTTGILSVTTIPFADTELWWVAAVPYMQINIDGGECAAHDWPLGAQMSITITGPEGLLYKGQFSNHPFDGPGHTVGCVENIYPNSSRKLQPGDLVNITDGFASDIYMISNARVTNVDIAADTISGIATPGNWVEAYVDPSLCDGARRFVLVNTLGNWSANFQQPDTSPFGDPENTCDIKPGFTGQAYDNSADGNATWINWRAPNTPPQITSFIVPVSPIPLGQSINATLEFSDSDLEDNPTATFEWGDGTTTTVPATSPSVTASHIYASADIYEVTASITDIAGETASTVPQFWPRYVVIFDSNGGFVTGGGWIMSPAGAYLLDPSLTGKANFGFNAKSIKGTNIPHGNIEFNFTVGDLNFHSDEIDGLILNNNDHYAKLTGWGEINDTGNYRYVLIARDGSSDSFRIIIWDTAWNLIYDNGDYQPIGGGNILIHK